MELVTSVIIGLVAIVLGIALIIYAFKGRQSQARSSRDFRRGRL